MVLAGPVQSLGGLIFGKKRPHLRRLFSPFFGCCLWTLQFSFPFLRTRSQRTQAACSIKLDISEMGDTWGVIGVDNYLAFRTELLGIIHVLSIMIAT